MTQPRTLHVETEELLARAAELEDPIADRPSEDPAPPCHLAMTRAAAQQLSLSADNIRLYLTVAEREWRRLAESLRNAAKAYDEVDEGAAEAINSQTAMSLAARGPAGGALTAAQLSDTPVAAMADTSAFADLKQRALDNEAGDQGASFLRFAEAWEAHQRTLLEVRYRFRPFQHWYCEASHAVEQSFDLQRGWLDQMAAMCGKMADQARGVMLTQRWAQREHIWFQNTTVKYADLVQLDEQYRRLPKFRQSIMEIYAQLQAESDEVLAEYQRRASLPLAPLTPPKPPIAYRIAPPPKPISESPPPDVPISGGGAVPQPTNESPLDSANLFDSLGMSSLPSSSMPNAVTTNDSSDAWMGAPGLAAGVPAPKAAALRGGGVPGPARLPIGLPATSSSVPRSPSGAFPAADLGRAESGAMGSGGMGMAPLRGPGGKDQGGGKAGKRPQRDEEALYTEERPWTQGIIGRRRLKDAPDAEEPK